MSGMQATIQKAIWNGYAQAASVLGSQFDLYRPNGPTNPTGPLAWFGSIVAAVDDNSNYKLSKPNLYGHPEKFLLLNGAEVLTGDYLVGPAGTYFVAEMSALMPIVAMQCNVTLNVIRPGGNSGVGAQPYGGAVVALETPILTAWPGSVMQGYRGEKGDVQLPGDTRMPWYSVLLPPSATGPINAADVMTDNLGRRYIVSSTELTTLGWRLSVALATT